MGCIKLIDFIHVQSHQQLREFYWLLDEACINFNKHKQDQFAPDVYAALQRGQAEMFVGRHNGIPKGFFTCYVTQHPLQKPMLHIWHGYIQPGGPPRYLQAAFDYMNDHAKSIGCEKLVFTTSRKGWERAVKRSKFEYANTTFERKVT